MKARGVPYTASALARCGLGTALPTFAGMAWNAVRSASRRWLSPTLFAVVAIGFFLPFATVSCDSASTSFTGIQLVTHRVPPGGDLAGDEWSGCQTYIGRCVEQSASNTAGLALAVALAGLALGVVGVARGPGWCALVGLGAMLDLSSKDGFLGPDVRFEYGYQLAGWAFFAVLLVHVRRTLVRIWRNRSEGHGPGRIEGASRRRRGGSPDAAAAPDDLPSRHG